MMSGTGLIAIPIGGGVTYADHCEKKTQQLTETALRGQRSLEAEARMCRDQITLWSRKHRKVHRWNL